MGVRRLLPLVATLVIACDSDDSVESTNTRATAVVVDPAEFLGAFPCGAIEGAPLSYRATVLDVTDTANQVSIGTSPRLGCGTPVAFTEIDSGQFYGATIEVFDQLPGEGGDDLEPAWTTSCGTDGDHTGAARGRLLEQVIIRGCVPLGGAGTAVTAIIVDASAAAASLGCTDVPEGETPGPIDSISVTNTTEGVIGSTITVGCGQDPVRFESEIVPGDSYTFRLEAEDADGNLVAGASCEAVAREGLVVPAICQPLSDRAEIIIPVVELLAGEGIVCGEQASKVKATLTAGPTNTTPEVLPCDSDVRIPGVLAGSYLASLEVLDGTDTLLEFSCTGSAAPGSVSTLVCSPED